MNNDELMRLNELMSAGMAQHLARKVVAGKLDETTAWVEQRVSERGYELFAQPDAAWPNPLISWDLAPENWHRALDAMDAAAFAKGYPKVRLFEVDRDELERALAPAARRTDNPFSGIYRYKTAKLVAHLEAGRAVTPPLVHETTAGWAFAGGNHRFGWACHLQIPTIPILACGSESSRLATAAPSLRKSSP